MHIRTFRADNLQAALAEIRQQMGPSAAVLHTRQVRDGLWGWLGRTQVEVTAGMNDRQLNEGKAIANASSDQAGASSNGGVAVSPHADSSENPDSFSSQGQGRAGQPRVLPFTDDRLDLRSLNEQPFSQPPGQTTANGRGQHSFLDEDPPTILSAYASELQSMGVSPHIAKRWLESTISFSADLGEETLPLSWEEQIQRTVARSIHVSGPIRTQPGERHVVAVVGPTGVGKTTTVAKLAAGFRLEQRRRVGLLTIDTFRIAAVQQLEAYAQIMDLPMEVVETRDQMRPALERLGDVDLVLIDTAGRSPRSDARIDQLVGFMDEARPDETHLVLSATNSPESIRQTCLGFAPVCPTAAIISKLDETSETAGVLAAVQDFNETHGGRTGVLPLSYVTNGQEVPDDIDVADVDRLVERLLRARTDSHRLEAA